MRAGPVTGAMHGSAREAEVLFAQPTAQDSSPTKVAARAKKRRKGSLSARRTHVKSPLKDDLLCRETLRPLKRRGRARTVGSVQSTAR